MEVEDRKLVNISSPYEAPSLQSTGIPAALILEHYTYPPRRTIITQSNVMVWSSEKTKGGEYSIPGTMNQTSALSDHQWNKSY